MVDHNVSEARSALREREWQRAHELFLRADAAGVLVPDELDAMADAAFGCGRQDASLAARERALDGFAAARMPADAAAMALKLANVHVRRGEFTLVAGLVEQAEDLLRGEPEGPAYGLLSWVQGMLAILGPRDLEAASALATSTIELGRRFANHDVEVLGLAMRAEVLLKRDQLDDGGVLIDQAMTVALGATLAPWVSCHVLCRTMTVCQEVGDLRRAQQWCDATRVAAGRERTIPLLGDCRVHHAQLLTWQGDWREAEQEASAGIEELPRDLLHVCLASYELGEIALRRGDFDAAQEHLQRTHELGFRSPQPALAHLRAAQGRGRAAMTMLRVSLEDEELPVVRSLLLSAEAEIGATCGDSATAEQAASELAALASRNPGECVTACWRSATGAAALARGDTANACRVLRDAVRRWTRLRARHRTAAARMLLAQAYLAQDDPDDAELELRAALHAFEQLGARPDAERARLALRQLTLGGDTGRGERPVTRAFMFTDIVNSTPLVAALGDHAWRQLLRWHDRVLREIFREHHGHEIDHPGDGFFVTFDGAYDALCCAQDIQRRLERHRRDAGFAPQVRVGVHVDEAMQVDDGYRGHGVHVAARIGAQAIGSEILVSRLTLEAAGSEFAVGETRSVVLKGVNHPVTVAPLLWS